MSGEIETPLSDEIVERWEGEGALAALKGWSEPPLRRRGGLRAWSSSRAGAAVATAMRRPACPLAAGREEALDDALASARYRWWVRCAPCCGMVALGC